MPQALCAIHIVYLPLAQTIEVVDNTIQRAIFFNTKIIKANGFKVKKGKKSRILQRNTKQSVTIIKMRCDQRSHLHILSAITITTSTLIQIRKINYSNTITPTIIRQNSNFRTGTTFRPNHTKYSIEYFMCFSYSLQQK